MLIEINLLPKKESKGKSLLLLFIISTAILLIGVLSILLLNRTYVNKIASIDRQISTNEQLAEMEQKKKTPTESTSSQARLAETVEWAKKYPVKSVPVLKKLTSLLPERGFIQSYDYEEAGVITLGVQFEETREAAYYLNLLDQSDWFKDVKLLNIQAKTHFYDKKFGQSERDETELKNKKYIPRYFVEYEITLDSTLIKSNTAAKSSEKKEGEGS